MLLTLAAAAVTVVAEVVEVAGGFSCEAIFCR